MQSRFRIAMLVFLLLLGLLQALPAAAQRSRSLPLGERRNPEANVENWFIQLEEYQRYPQVARDLRCQALLEEIAWMYFGTENLPSMRIQGVDTLKWGALKPRISAEEERLSAALRNAALAPADRAWNAAKQWPASSYKNYLKLYNGVRYHAGLHLAGGRGAQALNARSSQCLADPAADPLAQQVQALLAKPIRGLPTMAGVSFMQGLPMRLPGYLYQPEGYRYIVCASLVESIANQRFGHVPGAGEPTPQGWETGATARLSSQAAAFRSLHVRTARAIHQAGMGAVGAVTPADRQAWQQSYSFAAVRVSGLAQKGVAEEKLRDPAMGCSGFAGVKEILAPAASATIASGPVGIRSWPDRRVGYLADDAAFRPMFCSALVHAAYNWRVVEKDWFRAPAGKQSHWSRAAGFPEPEPASPAELQMRQAVRKAIQALYEAGQVDAEAKRWGNGPNAAYSVYGGDYNLLLNNAQSIVQARKAVAAFNEPRLACASLPQLAPVLAAVRQRLAAEDGRR